MPQRKVKLLWCDDCDRWEVKEFNLDIIIIHGKSKQKLIQYANDAGWEIHQWVSRTSPKRVSVPRTTTASSRSRWGRIAPGWRGQ